MKNFIRTTIASLAISICTAQSPVLLEDINANNSSNDPNGALNGSIPTNFLEYNNTLYFLASEETPANNDLFRVDGGNAINVSTELGSLPESLSEMVVYNNMIYFSASGRLYKTSAVAQIGGNNVTEIPLQGINVIGELTVFNNKLYFSGFTSFRGTELYEISSNDFVRLVADLATGSDSFTPTNLISTSTTLFFRRNNGDRWWKFTGTGTPSVVPSANYRSIVDYIIYNNELYFTAETDLSMGGFLQTANSLFSTDGNSSPELIMDQNLFITKTGYLGIFKNKLVVDGEVLGFNFSQEFLGFYDGSSLTRIPKMYSSGKNFTENNDTLYFTASSSTDSELWRYVESNIIEEVANINPSGSSLPQEFFSFENNLFFSANDGANGRELWAFGKDYKQDIISTVNLASLYQKQLQIYPNPAFNMINVPKGLTKLYDFSGKLILKENTNGQLDVSGLNTGVYIITVNGLSTKLVKK